MPVVKVYVPEDTLTTEQRREIVQGLHEVLNAVEKRPPAAPTYVLINEVPVRDWGYAGKVPTP